MVKKTELLDCRECVLNGPKAGSANHSLLLKRYVDGRAISIDASVAPFEIIFKFPINTSEIDQINFLKEMNPFFRKLIAESILDKDGLVHFPSYKAIKANKRTGGEKVKRVVGR